MKAYQLISSHNDYDLGCVECVVRTYSNEEAAKQAKEWFDSLPENPFEICRHETSIRETEVEDTFVPWIPEEQIAAMKAEEDAYYAHMEAEERQAAMEDKAMAQMQAEYEAAMQEYYERCCSE